MNGIFDSTGLESHGGDHPRVPRADSSSLASEAATDEVTCTKISAVSLDGMPSKLTPQHVVADQHVRRALERGVIELSSSRITYHVRDKRTYSWTDPEEWVRAWAISYLVMAKGYPANRIRLEVTVPRRTPEDFADIVVYRDDRCRDPYLVVECKAAGQSTKDRKQAIEQLFGNANSLRAPLGLYEEFTDSVFFDIAQFPPTERAENIKGNRDAVPPSYGDVPLYTYVVDGEYDIRALPPTALESRIRRAHSLIWAGGKRDPLTAFEEWSKLLFAKVHDERTTERGKPRRFQIGTNETTTVVASRVHELFGEARETDATIFPPDIGITLNDKKITDVVRVLQDISFTATDVDAIGVAFEHFFGSVFRGELGQYFTMRQLARFTVAMLDIQKDDFIIDPTAGSGGFLLEAMLQVWHSIATTLPQRQVERAQIDFALQRVYGVEIHETLARICKINLLLHHDGHTHVEADRSCLDATFDLPRLNPPREKFTVVVGNPPFGDSVEEGDEDHLGSNHLEAFTVAEGRDKVPSEHVILERVIDLLQEGGRLGLILPDGLFNNQGENSNCPRVRRYLLRSGFVRAIVSLPDYAFRKAGAQNKTSILFFQKFTRRQALEFEASIEEHRSGGLDIDTAIGAALTDSDYLVFLAEANNVGYAATGAPSNLNDLYDPGTNGTLSDNQANTILGEYRRFWVEQGSYAGSVRPDTLSMTASEIWKAHESRRLDPKYFLFKREGALPAPHGWIKTTIGAVMRRRTDIVVPEESPDQQVNVMTITQAGEIRRRAAGKGQNPPEWLGMYFEESPSTWYRAVAGDVVFSSIDLWKGCIAVVPADFDGALVTKEFPIYEVTDERLDPDFLSCLLRSRYYQRAFRAITTGHSNRRRTQIADFEALEISFPPERAEQHRLIAPVMGARHSQVAAHSAFRLAMNRLSDIIDHRGDEELPEISAIELEDEE
jgi:type I restriction enzyme M protein